VAAPSIMASGISLAQDPPPYAEPRDESAQYVVETLLEHLDNPCGLALRPGTPSPGPFEIFLSESGAGRVIRLLSDKAEEWTTAVADFPLAAWSVDDACRVGPLGLEFLSRNRLAVGTGGLEAGADLVRMYDLPSHGAALTYDQADHSAGPVPPGGRSTTGEGDFYSLAKTEDALFATACGDDRGWVLKAILDANRAAGLEPFIATRAIAGVAGPTAAVVDPKPNHHYLVIGQMGEPTDALDSRITFYSPIGGDVAMNLATGLRDIVSLAYSPTGDLYAADLSLADASHSGVYRIEAATVDGRQSCRAVKIAAVVHPTALMFTPNGELYVTAFGEQRVAGAEPTGLLLKITPQADAPKL
jgi:hypothetical protein